MPRSRRPFPEQDLPRAAAAARIELSPERASLLAPALAGIYRLIDRLDEVPLGETPPAASFDARWER